MSSSVDFDITTHLSSEARERKPNPMKEIWRLTRRKPNALSLANGDPDFRLFPLKSMDFHVASTLEADPVAAWRSGPDAPHKTLHSFKEDSCALPLRTALQYSSGLGLMETQKVLTELTNFYHSPPDHAVTLTLGNGDGVTKCFRLLGEKGDFFLTDDFSFMSLINAPLAQGIKWLPIRNDAGGLIPDEMERLLSGWDNSWGRRPHVLYTVPCGQNPTGSTLTLERRKRIYEICQRFDVVIIEDDPYYYLQFDAPEPLTSPFIPSFLSMDVDGRVIRNDSFSKIIAPGMRLGWITSTPLFQDILVTFTDSTTQQPHGFGQALITELLGAGGWQIGGFDRWVRGLRTEYQRRRDFFLAALARTVDPAHVSAPRPAAGMFIWVRVHVERHPRFRCDLRREDRAARTNTNTKALMEELFERLLDDDLVVMPGSMFAVMTDERFVDREDPIEDHLHYVRLTFAGTEETMEKGITILGKVLRAFFADEKQ
ncbi:pyridoxal phosphate-dependent transferase [Amylocystis lapponica]|nr:pyridoxal phosphate-dependent transferase [Amylocystis lapponica]